MFFPPVSFIFFALPFLFFFLRWHGSLWCSWIKSSVQDSQCETALMGNWRSDITLRVMSSLFLATLLIFTMLAAVLSQRVVLQRHKKKQGKHYDHIQQSHSTPFIKRRFFILPHKEHNGHLRILWLPRPFDYLGIWASFLIRLSLSISN